MKIIFVTRLFSGLEKSFLTKKWSPTGVPTIYKMIELLDRTHDTEFLFTVKDSGKGYFSSWKAKSNTRIKVDKLNKNIVIISGVRRFPFFLGRKIRIAFREMYQFTYILLCVLRNRPNVLYCDNSNIIVGAIVARILKNVSVVFRVMGINQHMYKVINNNGIILSFYKWIYKSPFKIVICTQDGSGVELWVNKAFRNNTNVKILVNGVDSFDKRPVLNNNIKKLISNKTSILFVGKLEIYKGCFEFIKAIEILINKDLKNFHVIVIGNGTQRDRLISYINNFQEKGYITFIDSLPNSEILSLHRYTDIYVSMNHLGNLSNANLEAISSNDCIVIPEAQYEKGIDIITNKLLGEAVTRVPINNPEILSSILFDLVNNRSKRELLSSLIKKKKKSFLYSWDERLNYELKLLSLLDNKK